MARIELAPQVVVEFDRFFERLAQFGADDLPERLAEATDAVEVSTHSPLIGRPVRGGKRELLIGRGSRGCVAPYRFVPDIDAVIVLAIRSQREAGYPGGR